MLVRTTSFVQFERAATELRRQQQQSLKYQSELTSGTRIERASDDPFALPAFLGAHRDIKRIEGVRSTLNQVKLQVSGAHEAVRQAQSILVDAKVLASEVRQVTEPTERQAIAEQIDKLLDRMLAIANEEGEYGYLFSGGAPATQPFVEGPDGSIQYQGGSRASQVNIEGRSPIDRLLAGSVVFEYTERHDTLFFGSTGARPGIGTDNGKGRGSDHKSLDNVFRPGKRRQCRHVVGKRRHDPRFAGDPCHQYRRHQWDRSLRNRQAEWWSVGCIHIGRHRLAGLRAQRRSDSSQLIGHHAGI